MRWGLAVLVAVGGALPSLAQSEPRPTEVIIDVDPNGPGARQGSPTRVPLPPEGPGRDAFMKEFVRVDPRENEAWQASRVLSASEFYTRVNRPDLAARADERTRQKIWLISGSVVVLAAGVAGGAVVLANAQDVNDPACFVNGNISYNDCVSRHQNTTNTGVAIIGATVVAAAGLLTWGLLIPEMVTPPEETVRLATEYNRALGQKYGASSSSGVDLRIVPALAPGYAGLTARLRF